MPATSYRLRLSTWSRSWRLVTTVLIALFFIPGVAEGVLPLWWRALSIVGLVFCVLAARTLLGPVLVVRDQGLRIQRTWPIRRDIPWYRILSSDVVPGFWHLELELNSGERIELPPVDDIEGLYRNIELHRTALDA